MLSFRATSAFGRFLSPSSIALSPIARLSPAVDALITPHKPAFQYHDEEHISFNPNHHSPSPSNSPSVFLNDFSLPRVASANLLATSSVFSKGSIRLAHTDVQVPDFTHYRRGEKPTESGDPSRRAFSYFLVGTGGVIAATVVKSMVVDFVSTMSASADVLALAKVEVDLSTIPLGKNIVVTWRGKPLFVRHRTAEEIADAQSVDVSSLRHQETDEVRVQRPEWLVLLGVCTHLGCVPMASAGDFGGYFCPCHGSHYDVSGRIRKGPAPLNLEVPPYTFLEENKIVVG